MTENKNEIQEDSLQKIKDLTEEFLSKMTMDFFEVQVLKCFTKNEHKKSDVVKNELSGFGVDDSLLEVKDQSEKITDIVDLVIKIKEPRFLIGKNGQTLFELERLLRIFLSKKIDKNFYLNLDINDYKKKKIEYLKQMANNIADEVSSKKEKKVMPNLNSYERRIVHEELSKRHDVKTESFGEGEERYLSISSSI